jgi:tRNA isopentenyl-2-thiomethyl-A-37 hydroxylase MiaE
MDVRDAFYLTFMNQLLATNAGRAHVLNQIAESEGQGEAQIFDQVLSQVDDPKLARMVEKHSADEIRHEALFRACLARTGIEPGPVPAELRLMDRLDRALGGFLARKIQGPRDVMDAYLVLQVIEERALHQFGLMERAFRRHDAATAAVLAEVARDEVRHLRYCHAIARRYAPDEATRRERLRAIRLIEASAFRDNSAANMAFVLERGFVKGTWSLPIWGLVRELASGDRAPLPFTSYASSVAPPDPALAA